MYTDAKSSAVRKAVKKLSNKYKGNIVFNRKPEKVRKTFNLIRFTIKTLDKTKAPSRLSARGRLIYKASWQAHNELMTLIFKLDKSASFFDTALGRFERGFKATDVDIRTKEQIESGEKPILYSQTEVSKGVKSKKTNKKSIKR
jgi:hypothetical protein